MVRERVWLEPDYWMNLQTRMQSLRSYKEVLWQNANADTHMCTAFHVHTYQNLAKNENEKYLSLSLLAESLRNDLRFDFGISISKILILNTMSCLITIYNFSSDFSSLCMAHYSWVMCLWIVLLLRAAICEPIFLTSRRPILDMIVASFLFQPSQPLFFLADGI